MPGSTGRPTDEGKTARGGSSQGKPALRACHCRCRRRARQHEEYEEVRGTLFFLFFFLFLLFTACSVPWARVRRRRSCRTFSCGEKRETPLEKRHLQHQLENEKMTQNLVLGGTHEDFNHEELECQRIAQREALLNPVLGKNLEDGALHHAELEC